MRWFLDLSTQVKLIWGFGALWILFAVVAWTGYANLDGISNSIQRLHDVDYTVALRLQRLRFLLDENRVELVQQLMIADKSKLAATTAGIADRDKVIADDWATIAQLQTAADFRTRLKEVQSLYEKYLQTRAREIELMASDPPAAQRLAVTVQNESFRAMSAILTELVVNSVDGVTKRLADYKTVVRDANLVFLAVGALSVLLSVLLIVLLQRLISRPLLELTRLAERVAGGDLAVTPDVGTRKDEVGVLTQAFGRMVGNLRVLTADIAESVDLLVSAANGILAGSAQVAASTAETAAAINETTTTVEEVRQAAQLSSEKARVVTDKAQLVVQIARDGEQAVDESAVAMGNIRQQMESIAQTIVHLSQQTQSIGGIIASVTDIADQSNLLAVNAAIEAARVGEAGKGFSVVAQEIRSLAEQSKQATAQVRTILNDIQTATNAAVLATEQGTRAVESGTAQAAQAGNSIRTLAEGSEEAVQSFLQIAASSQQQFVGLDQIEVAMRGLNQAGRETAASMKQAESEARGLDKLGRKLKEAVERFKQ